MAVTRSIHLAIHESHGTSSFSYIFEVVVWRLSAHATHDNQGGGGKLNYVECIFFLLNNLPPIDRPVFIKYFLQYFFCMDKCRLYCHENT